MNKLNIRIFYRNANSRITTEPDIWHTTDYININNLINDLKFHYPTTFSIIYL